MEKVRVSQQTIQHLNCTILSLKEDLKVKMCNGDLIRDKQEIDENIRFITELLEIQNQLTPGGNDYSKRGIETEAKAGGCS